jgi:hypothetical protein
MQRQLRNPDVRRSRAPLRLDRLSVATAALCVAAVATILGGALVFVLTPALFAPGRSPGFGPISSEKARHDARTSSLQLLAGVVVATGAFLTARTVRLAQEANAMQREGQITDRFARSVELLGHEREAVRLGGLFALGRIAADSPEREHVAIMNLLVSYASSHGTGSAWGEPASPGVEAAVTLLGQRDRTFDAPGFNPGLDELGLRNANLRRLNLSGVRLRGANLVGARLEETSLVDAVLTRARYDASTRWPEGFDPVQAGAVRV